MTLGESRKHLVALVTGTATQTPNNPHPSKNPLHKVPPHKFDRTIQRSGLSLKGSVKKQGSGKRNWGTIEDDLYCYNSTVSSSSSRSVTVMSGKSDSDSNQKVKTVMRDEDEEDW
ncbi:hypothetical protein HDU76_011661 [Blyttiomyces sp. JEL0837]|nr:hypothetical protein HDU76_011661 [Blyttiomyces sp. JEL0837]